MYIASAKILEREGNFSSSSFYGQPPDNKSHASRLAYPVDEFSFKEMRTWGQSKITSYCICVWCESGELKGKRSSGLPCVTTVGKTSYDRVAKHQPELLCENS